MEEFLINIIKGIGLAFVITTFEPIQWVLDMFKNNIFKYVAILLTSCWKCASFWLTLFMFGLWEAVAAYSMVYIIMELKEKITRYYERSR
jgi:hypothetical protein